MNLKQLTYFVRAVEVGNITHAADQLHIAQTALGIQIRNLERELGVALLDRHSRGVQPTPAGELLIRHARDILARVEGARQEVMAAGRADRIPVTVGITPSIMRLVGAELVMEARRLLPEVTIRMVEEFSFMLHALLQRGDLDYALAYDCPELPSLSRTPMIEEDLLFVSSPDQSGGEGAIRFSEAIGTDLALASRQDVIYHLVHAEAARLGLEVNVAYELQSVRAIKNLVAKGVATSFLPKGAMVEELRRGTLAARLVERPRLTRTLFLARQARGVAGLDTARFEALIRMIVDRLTEAIGEHARPL